MCSVNTSTLEVKELIHEVDKPYRDPHARSVEVLNDGKDILFRSERTGWGHYYHYDGQGNLKNAISSGPWVSGHIAAIDTLQRTVYFMDMEMTRRSIRFTIVCISPIWIVREQLYSLKKTGSTG